MMLSSDAHALVDEVAHIATMPGRAVHRAQALLEPLQRVTPCDSLLITVFDAEKRRQLPLVRHGFGSMRQYVHTDSAQADLERVGLLRNRLPLRLADVPIPRSEIPIWAEHLQPAGFRETLGTGLFTEDGRHLGLVSVNTGDPRPPSEESRVLLHRLRPLIASAVDPLRDVAALADVVADASAGVVCTADGHAVALPGLPEHPVLAAGSPVLTAVRNQLADGLIHAVFLCPPEYARDDVDTGPQLLYRVTALGCSPRTLGHLRSVVLLSPAPQLYGLTGRELEVLGLLVKGWSNARMAATLTCTVRTVESHVEHILVKLRVTSRTMAAVRALRQGLFVPPELIAHAHRSDSEAGTANTSSVIG